MPGVSGTVAKLFCHIKFCLHKKFILLILIGFYDFNMGGLEKQARSMLPEQKSRADRPCVLTVDYFTTCGGSALLYTSILAKKTIFVN